MAFVFRLERVLAVRRIEEDGARQRHAAAQQELAAARAAVDHGRRRLEASLEGLDDLKRGDRLTEEALYLHSLHLAGLRREMERAGARVTAGEQAVERAAAELLKAHQAREALEKLREREATAYRQKQAARETREMDEIAVRRSRTREEEKHGP